MSYLEYRLKRVPKGLKKILFFHWGLFLLTLAAAGVGFLMLYSVSGGNMERWAEPQMQRFALSLVLMFIVAFVPIWFWRNMSVLAYGASLVLLILVEVMGETGMGAQRWINLGFMNLQPSEIAKVTLVMVLAAYYDRLGTQGISRPRNVVLPLILIGAPMLLVLRQPDLGTALLLAMGGGAMMFLAGVHWLYFAIVTVLAGGTVGAVFISRGTSWQLIKDYQFRRIDTFLDPASDPLGAGYHIMQSKIALGSGGWTGRGFMQGTQARLNFLPEKHTDFIFTTLAEEFGFIGCVSLLGLYAMIIVFCIASGIRDRDRFASLLTLGIAATFFLFFAINMAMVMGLAPVVGVPLPLVSYGGSALLVLMVAFGLVQSAHIHRAR